MMIGIPNNMISLLGLSEAKNSIPKITHLSKKNCPTSPIIRQVNAYRFLLHVFVNTDGITTMRRVQHKFI